MQRLRITHCTLLVDDDIELINVTTIHDGDAVYVARPAKAAAIQATTTVESAFRSLIVDELKRQRKSGGVLS